MLQQIILIFHILFCIALICLILVQQGKGATMGASFGSGASQTVFGSQGSGGFLVKLTGGLAILFFVTSVSLTYLSTKQMKAAQHGQISPVTQQLKSSQSSSTQAGASKPAKTETTKETTAATPTAATPSPSADSKQSAPAQ